jgi:DNA (cytosine-5)-methyltransferase 1
VRSVCIRAVRSVRLREQGYAAFQVERLRQVKELSLFSGAGGGLLGTKWLLGWETMGYVEYEPYCQKVLRQRIADGLLDPAPIFGDIRRFISEGYAASYAGLVDVVSGGFPCQPFSVAGKRAGADDPRNMWPATIECVRIVRPRFAFLENVPGLLNSGYFGRIIGDLAEAGYGVRWCVLSAADCGAPHRRERLWIMAYARCGNGEPRWTESQQDKPGTNVYGERRGSDVADAGKPGLPKRIMRGGLCGESGSGKSRPIPVLDRCAWWDQDPADVYDHDEHGNKGSVCAIQDGKEGSGPARGGISGGRPVKSFVGRVVDELANRLDEPGPIISRRIPRVAKGVRNRVSRLKAIGNGQVSVCAAAAWCILRGE